MDNPSGAFLSFNHLSYTVFGEQKLFSRCRGAGEGKQLLTDICGYARPGSMVALMGASGAGVIVSI
jgi:ABC-type multidrug transport system ATPase subunit